MKKSIIFSLLLTIAAQGAWAKNENYYPALMTPAPSDGVWTFEAVNNRAQYIHVSSYREYYSFNQLDHTTWGKRSHDGHPIIYQWKDGDGLGFSLCSHMAEFCTFGVFSTYYHDETLPPYTRRKLTWKFKLRSRAGGHFHANTCLYSHSDLDSLKNLKVRWWSSSRYEDDEKGPYCIKHFFNKGSDFWGDTETNSSGNETVTFDFDNRNGSDTIVKSWYLMLTHVEGDNASYDDNVHHWSSFDTQEYSWKTWYYKYISFNNNDGKGIMQRYDIENSGTLPANTFTREGYTFAGWATSPNGEKVYDDGAAVTATANSKGPVTLYAVWKAQPASVVALINAIGTVEYTADCNARILAARAAYDELSAAEKEQVTNYSTLEAAETLYNAVDAVVTSIDALSPVTTGSGPAIIDAQAAYGALTDAQKALLPNFSALIAAQELYEVLGVIVNIDAIGEVEHTEEYKEFIDATRAAYNTLSDAQKMRVTNYATLLAAEAAYADLGKTALQFVGQDGTTPVGDSQRKSIAYPELPDGATQWQTVEKDASDKTIVIKAVK